MIERKQRAQRQRKIRLLKLSIWIIIIYFVLRFISEHFQVNNISTLSTIISPTSQPQRTDTPAQSAADTLAANVPPTPSITNSSGLETVIQNALIGTNGNYSVVIKNLKTNESYAFNADTQYDSGSLYKLWVMAVIYNKIAQGKLHEHDVLNAKITDLNKAFYINPDSAEKTSGTITLSVQEALDQMITISDNYAALLLTQKIELSSLTTFLQQEGFHESQVGRKGNPPLTTPSDMALFFEKLYKGQLNNQQYTDKMIALLKRQKLNEKIPEYIPDGISIAHKTGELDQFSHDAGIIYADSGPYIIVVLSKSDSRDQANERIAQISQNVYNYFEKISPSPSL